ncbi:hypothetical protein VP1G_10613 [Cytospora mali]|uniref:Uncharacterized protein n=1 Tax=Cytospora mali TaxID=578113 RepID=A0A194UR60_CYTMA|nr:hypothetical protein VP1G_10613 [Valsa mali var. pyri (nom. inval.)]
MTLDPQESQVGRVVTVLHPERRVLSRAPRHLKLLVRRAHQHPVAPSTAATAAADIPHHAIADVPRRRVPRVVDREPQTGTALHHRLAEPVAPLADAAREHQGVDLAPQADVVRPDVGADAVDEEVEGELVRGVGGGRVGDDAEVGGAGEGLPPGFFVEHRLGHGDVEFLCRGRGEPSYRHAGMELGIEAGDVDGAGELVHAALDDLQAGRVVQRRQVVELLQPVVRGLVDDLRRAEVAPVHDAVAHDGDVLLPPDLREAGIVDERLQDGPPGVVLLVHLAAHVGVLGDGGAAAGVG